ncbi:hypothetical protein QQ045_010707 [Rhodiola kirilowii]
MDIDQSSEHDAQENLEEIPSIRCKHSQNAQSVSGDEGGQKRRPRGVVNGTNLAQYKQTRNRGQPIKKLGETMSRVRTESERIDHRSGKVPFYMRSAQLRLQGERAPIVATYSKVDSHDPAGAALAAQMEERVRQALQDMDGDEDEDPEGTVIDARPPLPVDIQIKIINEVLGPKRGTYVSGAGRAFRKPPLPRGGSARTAELIDKLQKTQDEMMEMKAAFEERIRILEELAVRGGSANVNASEGATSLCGS